jgi:hypothetical protein
MDCLSLSLGDDEREQLFGPVSSFRNHVSQELAGKSMKNPARAIVRSSASRKAIRFMDFQVWSQQNASTSLIIETSPPAWWMAKTTSRRDWVHSAKLPGHRCDGRRTSA